jgi:transcriptional regulator with PAS, ATPase and Fis domain
MMKYALIGNHAAVQKIRELITLVSETAFNVLISGETGTGKEIVARLLHQASPRRDQRFVKVNCAALPLTLLESEFFGYEKGAFTGAEKAKPGKFELASKGIIFLDEIGDMPLPLQAKMLHVLQSGEFNRLGGNEDIKVNAWVVASTNHDLAKDMDEGHFREDLYYRLNIIRVEIPPLCERKEDIPLLTEHFIRMHRQDMDLSADFSLSPGLADLFQSYHWPGNVRELSSVLLRLMMEEDPLEVENELLRSMEADGYAPPDTLKEGRPDSDEQAGLEIAETFSPVPLKTVKMDAARHIEERAIRHALEKSAWNKREAARMLRISYKTLFNKMNDLGVEKGK